MRLERLDNDAIAKLGGPAGVARYVRALIPDAADVAQPVQEIVARVRAEGDAAVLDLTRKLDTAGADPLPLAVPPEDLDHALAGLDRKVHAALEAAIANVAQVAHAMVTEGCDATLPQGQFIRIREIPIAHAAIYVPGGRAPYPSTVVMGVVTARAAGVMDVSLCSPPGPSGEIDPLVLAAARLCGASRVFRMGGAQAVAAFAFGTDSVPRADVIVGPGNLYVQEAKRQLSGIVGVDGFAGPSDLVLLASSDAPVHIAAYDLLAQAEHGPGTLITAIADSEQWLWDLNDQLELLAGGRPSADPGALVLLLAHDRREGLAIAQELAPEHLQLMGAAAEALAPLVTRAGCVLVGWPSGTAYSDYIAGTNHVLPTGGTARFASGLTPRTFRRTMAEVHIGSAVETLAHTAAPLARAEGFTLHAESMEARAVPPAPNPHETS